MLSLSRLAAYPVKSFCNLYRPLSSLKADKASLLKLRRTTGLSFSVCKEALIKNNNDFNEAFTWIKQEAVRRGWDKANQLSNRLLSQGLLGVLSNSTHAVIVEVNCETDFVARNDQFQNLVACVTEAFMNNFVKNTEKPCWNTNELSTLVLPDGCGTLVSDKTASLIGTVGENMSVRRGMGMCTQNAASQLAVYSHLSSGDIRSSIRDVQFGKYAAIARYRPSGDETPSVAWMDRAARLGRQLCQHIVGMNPRPGLDLTEPAADPDDERCLLRQPFFLDETITVGEHLTRNDIVLEDFVRVECGSQDDCEQENVAGSSDSDVQRQGETSSVS